MSLMLTFKQFNVFAEKKKKKKFLKACTIDTLKVSVLVCIVIDIKPTLYKMLGCFNLNLGQIWTNPNVGLKCN